MALSRRQVHTYEIFDDQSPTMMRTYEGNWTHYNAKGYGYENNTYTSTTTPGASFSLTFTGSIAYLYGILKNNSDISGNSSIGFPAAAYSIDGAPSGQPTPEYDSATDSTLYFWTPPLADGTHVIDVNVTVANSAIPYIIDYFLVLPPPGSASGDETTRVDPSFTSIANTPTNHVIHHIPIGPIVGGVVGGVAIIAILSVLAFYFLSRRSRRGQAYYFEKPGSADALAIEGRVEPFNTVPATPATPGSAISSTGYSRPGPQSAYSDGSSNQPLNPAFGQTFVNPRSSQFTQSGPSESGLTSVSGTSAQPRTEKAALIAQQYQNVQQPTQHSDSGMRFDESGEQQAGPSQLPQDVPPTYTPN